MVLKISCFVLLILEAIFYVLMVLAVSCFNKLIAKLPFPDFRVLIDMYKIDIYKKIGAQRRVF